MTAYDVVVVGGRVAGASTALLLARAGARVALLDRSTYGSDTLSTHALMRAGVLQLTRWGVLPAVAARTPAIHRTTFHYEDGRTVPVTIRPSTGVDALYAPRRTLLDRVLVDAAREEGADVVHDTRVTSLLRDHRGTVTGVLVDGPGGRLRLPAAMTIGADGLTSTVAEQAGARVLRQGSHASAVLYRFVDGLQHDGYEWSYGNHAAVGVIPTGDGLANVNVSTSPQRMRTLRRAGTEEAFDQLLRVAAPSLRDGIRAGGPVGRFRGWAGRTGFVRQGWGPGWALVGDAAYFKDPITAHGITDALRDAELLATSVLGVLGGVPPRRALGAYDSTRLRLSAQLFAVTDAIAAYDWDQPRIEGLLRWLSSAMSDEVDHLAALPLPSAPAQVAGGPDNRVRAG